MAETLMFDYHRQHGIGNFGVFFLSYPKQISTDMKF